MQPSHHQTASYYALLVNGKMNIDAFWYHADPKPEAAMVRDRVAFRNGVQASAWALERQ